MSSSPGSAPADCTTCPVRQQAVFCNLSLPALEYLQRVRVPSHVPKGATICFEGQPVRGIYIVCSGRAKLTTTATSGRSLIMRIVRPGEAIGLTSHLLSDVSRVSAETMEGTLASFIARADLTALLHRFPEVEARVVAQLAHNYRHVFHELRCFGLSRDVGAKLAGLLLDELGRSCGGLQSTAKHKLQLHMTHEDIAEMIGSTRETVSRQLTEFKHSGLIRIDGATLTVLDVQALQQLVA